MVSYAAFGMRHIVLNSCWFQLYVNGINMREVNFFSSDLFDCVVRELKQLSAVTFVRDFN